MKKFLLITGYSFLAVLACLYFIFILILPHTIDLNKYKPEVQKLVKENTGLTLDFDKVQLVTTPFLEAGIKVKNISVKLPDKSELLHADSVKGKVFLPALLRHSVRVTSADIESPNVNLEIVNSEKYKVAGVYEDLVNRKRQQHRLNPPQNIEFASNSIPFDSSSLKIFIPAIKLNNYQAVIDDTKASHRLTLKGEKLRLGYYNGKIAKLKTNAQFLSDDETNITANLDIDTFLPKFEIQQQEENYEEVFALPFVNPVTVYRNYNLKSNISSKIKIRQSKNNGKIWMKGFFNIEDTTVTLSDLQLPKSYFKMNTKGYIYDFDTNFFVTDEENIKFTCK